MKSVEQYFPVVYLLLCTRCVFSFESVGNGDPKYDHLNDSFCPVNILFKPIRACYFHPGGYSAVFEGLFDCIQSDSAIESER